MNMLMPVHYAMLLHACGTVDTHEPAQQRWTPQETLRRPVAHLLCKALCNTTPKLQGGAAANMQKAVAGALV